MKVLHMHFLQIQYFSNMCIYRDTGGLASNPGVEDGEKSTWYPLFVHALNYYIKPRGFMQMTSQNFRDETTMTTLSSRANFTSNTNGITMTYHNQYVDRVSSYTHFKDALSGNLMHAQTVYARCSFPCPPCLGSRLLGDLYACFNSLHTKINYVGMTLSGSPSGLICVDSM